MPTVTSLNAADYAMVANSGNDETQRLQAAINDAQSKQLPLFIPAGSYHIGTVMISAPLALYSNAGRAIFRGTPTQGPCIAVDPAKAGGGALSQVRISDIAMDGTGSPPPPNRLGLIDAFQVNNLTIERCVLRNSKVSGIHLNQSTGRIVNNTVDAAAETSIACRDSTVTVDGNTVSNSGNQGIQVSRTRIGDDGSIVSNNRISNTRADRKGSGAYGNAILVYRAGKVAVTGNKISGTAFSAVRANSGSDVQVIGNETTGNYECAIYIEAPGSIDTYKGCIVANNVIHDCGAGISVVNQDYGGRRGVITGNTIVDSKNRRVVDGSYNYPTFGTGISACADVVVSSNILENCEGWGITLDPTNYARAAGAFIAQADNNLLKNCAGGIVFCRDDSSAYVLISGNTIYGISKDAKFGAVVPGRYLGNNQSYGRLSDAAEFANTAAGKPFPNVMLGQNFAF